MIQLPQRPARSQSHRPVFGLTKTHHRQVYRLELDETECLFPLTQRGLKDDQAACRCHCSNKEDRNMLNFHYDTEMETTHDE
jgi:hypothetical protein